MKNQVVETTKKWIESFVIGLNICPFAKKSFVENQIYYFVSDWSENGGDIIQFLDFVYEMDEGEDVYSNGFFIVPEFDGDFEAFIAVVSGLEKLMREKELDEDFQIVGFHPKFKFAGADIEDAGNYVNRSSFPMIHLIRRKDVEWVEKNYPGIEKVPFQNAANLRSLGSDYIVSMFLQQK